MAAASHVSGEQCGPTSCSRPSPCTTVTPCLPSAPTEALGHPVSGLWAVTSEARQPARMSAQLSTCSVAVETGHLGAGQSGALPGTGAPGRRAMGNGTSKDLGSALWEGGAGRGRNKTAKMGTKTSSHMTLIPEISKGLEHM